MVWAAVPTPLMITNLMMEDDEMSSRTLASINLWSLLVDATAHDARDPAAAESVRKVAEQIHSNTEITLEVTENAWVIRIHGIEDSIDVVKLSYARSGHLMAETNTMSNDIIITKKCAW